MNIYLTNLSDDIFFESRKQLNKSAINFGINRINSYSFSDIIDSNFYRENEAVLSQKRGIGYWLWKPYIILDTFNKINDGDIVIYSDCGIEIINNLDPLLKILNRETDILLFANSNYVNKIWTKRDCFVLMDCDEDKYWNGVHCDAAFCLFKKSERSKLFLEDWLRNGRNVNVITDADNIMGKPNFPEFIEHRWDQSILSLLAIKFGLSLYRMPSQFGNHYKVPEYQIQNEFNCLNQGDQSQVNYYSNSPFNNSLYFQLLNHHRTKDELIVQLNEEKNSIRKIFSFIKITGSLKEIIYKVYRNIKNGHDYMTSHYKIESYSQCGEDILVKYIFKLRGIQKPSYIDVGANHPYFLSNTALFYKSGSRGLNIEANPSLLSEFNMHRPNDINLNIGIGERDEELDFYVMSDKTLSTFSKEECESLIKQGKNLEKVIRVKLTSISNIINIYFNGIFPDFLSIDVEGMDFLILKSIDYTKMAPKVICMEAADYSPIGAGERKNDLIDFLKSKGYYEYANTNLNAIMVKNEFWFI